VKCDKVPPLILVSARLPRYIQFSNSISHFSTARCICYSHFIRFEEKDMSLENNTLVVNLLGIVLGLFFLFAGARKLYGWEWAKNSYLKHHPLWVYYVSAVVEVVSGIGLILPPLRFAAVLLQLLLILCVSIHPWHHVEAKSVLPAVITTFLLLLLLWLTRP
jgi:uncharacterized membrane protein YphA (DoxX/SURF4 family)